MTSLARHPQVASSLSCTHTASLSLTGLPTSLKFLHVYTCMRTHVCACAFACVCEYLVVCACLLVCLCARVRVFVCGVYDSGVDGDGETGAAQGHYGAYRVVTYQRPQGLPPAIAAA